MENQEAYKKAKERVEEKIGFYIHLAVYIVVNSILIIINVTAAEGYFWAKWPLLGWGIGLFFHTLGVFIFSGKTSLTERMIEQEMRRNINK